MTTRQIEVPNFDIYLNGSKLANDVKKYISYVMVKDDLDMPSSFSFRYSTVNLLKGTWQGIDLDMFAIGDRIDIYLGMDKTKELISGSIDSLNVTFGDESSVEISGFSWLHKLTFGTITKQYTEKSDSEIASEIATRENLAAEVDSTDTRYDSVIQDNQSNFQFLLERAKRISYELGATEKSLIFRQSQENKSPVTTLKFGINLFDFSVTVNNLNQGSSVEVRGWDIFKKEEFSGSASEGDEDSKMGKSESGFKLSSGKSPIVLQASNPEDISNAKSLARDKYNELLLDFITGNGQCLGNVDIRAGKTIEVQGIGKKFSGIYYISSATHTLNSDSYQTQFDVKKTAI
ncbi:hypothetical protein BTA51_09340 [Hahella sp. CCB-MM4]|uniref:phage late control D family protein n=1 Tax=Hahella sp. (strain CCB-MM4) TaxID=1926491 RepID=UPI000B9BDA18|nr:phage late control D family protein [Hahella sp. CCB-MM4]OZG73973.1 hypothetical protein BTA51_09340 [Hahella sp. CCB-MM4]